MKYWFYSEGNILGPYEPADLLALPAFAEESLVCQESATGDNPGDWQPASQVAEIAAALSVGAGRAITAGVTSSIYEYETGYNPASVNYFENREPGPSSGYGELLDAIDNVLGAYKEPGGPAKAPETDYDLAEKFDIRLSRIQEELEAARWEKNLLLEKIRLKDMEEKKNAARIQELEARLKNEKKRGDEDNRELEQVRHLADLKSKADTLRQIEEIKKEEQLLKEDAAPAAPEAPSRALKPAAEPLRAPEPVSGQKEMQPPPPPAPEKRIEVKSFKSMKPGAEIRLESAIGRDAEEPQDDAGMTSRKLKSLGQTQHPAFEYGKPLPGPEAAPPGAFKPEELEPLPQQAGGLMYDFTVVTSRAPDVQRFQIEPVQENRPVKPPTYDMGIAPAPAPQPAPAPAPQPMQYQPVQPVMPQPAPVPQPAPAPAPQPMQFQPVQPVMQQPAPQAAPAPAPAPAAQPQTFSPSAQPEGVSSPKEKAPAAPEDSPEKTQRIPVPETKKGKAETQKPADRPRRKGGRTAFIAILVIFGSMAAGGLGYFFLGEGVSLSEFSMLNIGSKKKPVAIPSQIEAPPEDAVQPEPEPAPVQPEPEPAPAPVQPVNENIKKALDIVKNYKLSGGRGPVSTWFANSFLSNSGGASEEWTATPLHGDILVVQYRLLRPKKDPLIYQFEVDAAKQDIVRGINNNAIELLDLSSKEKSASAAPVRKPAAKPKARPKKPARSGEIPILPLPDAPAAGASEEDPTGFENPPLEPEQVRYLKAQESDEELF